MLEKLCPVCGCTYQGDGYVREGVTFCCESCALGAGCGGCHGCHHMTEEHE
jgi:hypothetical protein